MRQMRKLTKIVPEKETKSESKNRMVLDGAKMRVEVNHPMWSLVDGKLWPCPRVEVCDGETGRHLFTSGLGTDDKPKGRVHGAADLMEFRNARLNPIYFAFRGSDPEVCPYPMRVFNPTGASVPIGRSRCNEYVVNRGDFMTTAWFDPAAGYTIRRFTETHKGKLRLQIDAEHRNDEKWGWLPAAWMVTVYNHATGDLARTERVEVLSLRIGEPQLASEFRDAISARHVSFRHEEHEILSDQPDESMIEISSSGKPLGRRHEDPATDRG